VIGLSRAMVLLVDLIDVLRAGNVEDHLTIKVDLSELVTLAKAAEDAVSFDLFMERVSVEFRGSETHFVVRNRAEKDSVDAKLDLVARAVRLVSREIHTLASNVSNADVVSSDPLSPTRGLKLNMPPQQPEQPRSADVCRQSPAPTTRASI